LERHKPTLLLLELGANDGLRGIKTETMQDNLRQMIVMSQEAGAEVVLLGIRIPLNYGFTYTQKFEKVYVDLADKFDLPLLPFLLETVALDYDLMQSDGLHPTAEAQPKVLAHIMTMLKPILDGIVGASDTGKSKGGSEVIEKSESAAITN
jgi:acyl-CoA thioesterase-1